MSASFTRIIGGLNERVAILLEGSFRARRFSVSRDDAGWYVEPLSHDSFADTLTINEEVLSSRRPLRDDDVLITTLDHWVFHDGPTSRDVALEQSALEQGGGSWEVLADWLVERGDPLGERMNVSRGLKRTRSPLTLGSNWGANQLVEADEEHGLITALVLRSVTAQTSLLARLAQRRARFVERIVIDSPFVDVPSWMNLLESWPMPGSLRSLSLGTYLGEPPAASPIPLPSRRLRSMCPLLRAEALVRWNAKPTLTLETQTAVVDGLEPGATMPVRNGLKIERRGQRIAVHDGATQGEASVSFQLGERHCFLVPMVRERTLGDLPDAVADELSRTKLMHDDLIEPMPGVIFRFRLHA